MARKRSGEKPLTREIILDLGKSVEVAGVAIDPLGRIIVIGPDGKPIPAEQAIIEAGFDRDNPAKPRKVVSRAVAADRHPFHHIDLYLLQFQRHIFVDTNSKVVDGTTISVTAVISSTATGMASPEGRPTLDLRARPRMK